MTETVGRTGNTRNAAAQWADWCQITFEVLSAEFGFFSVDAASWASWHNVRTVTAERRKINTAIYSVWCWQLRTVL